MKKHVHMRDKVRETRPEAGAKRKRQMPPLRHQVHTLFGRMQGTVEILDDIIPPTGERWEVDES